MGPEVLNLAYDEMNKYITKLFFFFFYIYSFPYLSAEILRKVLFTTDFNLDVIRSVDGLRGNVHSRSLLIVAEQERLSTLGGLLLGNKFVVSTVEAEANSVSGVFKTTHG